jgi:ATP-dependent RNA helicase RhlE
MPFNSLGLAPNILEAISAANLYEPTPIQNQAIPAVLANQDLLGIAKTGSGKTAAYVWPILHRMQVAPASQHREPTVLVLVPTRELAIQVQATFQAYIPALKSRVICQAIHGGTSINPQMQSIGRANILVASPGRLLDLIEKNAIRLSSISTLVLDEADKMLNSSFKDELDRILSLLPKNRQNLLFSATLNEPLSTLQHLILRDPTIIKISEATTETNLIQQLGYLVSEENKGPLLRYLIQQNEHKQVLVFASSAIKVDRIVNKLLKNKIHAAAIHSKISQHARTYTLQQFKTGELHVLVATDLLGRGIDIEHLPCVINYELPRSPTDYIHRVGRTGRANASGDAISLVSPTEMPHFKLIQKKIETRIPLLHGDSINLHGC